MAAVWPFLAFCEQLCDYGPQYPASCCSQSANEKFCSMKMISSSFWHNLMRSSLPSQMSCMLWALSSAGVSSCISRDSCS